MTPPPADPLSDLTVACFHDGEMAYPASPPFHPDRRYPEYPFSEISASPNLVYHGVREVLSLLGLDRENAGTPSWNPLGEIIRAGDTVVIKPNFILNRHASGGELFSVITHPSVVRAAIDYVHLALRGTGKIVVADAPQMDCDFSDLLERTSLGAVASFYRERAGREVAICDLRSFWVSGRSGARVCYARDRRPLPGDPLGSVEFNLGKDSLFHGMPGAERFYGADYNREETLRHHRGETQEYLVSRSLLSADAVVLLPKLKVHSKVGATLNLKGLVGTVTNKNYLVHFRLGTPEEGGDQFPPGFLAPRQRWRVKLERSMYDILLARKSPAGDRLYDVLARLGKAFLKPLGLRLGEERSLLDWGNWHGNDSTWRMVADLARIFFYGGADGRIRTAPARQVFSLVDGVIGGEGNGPLSPDPKPCGLILGGRNPVAVDLAAVRLMGFDFRSLPCLAHALKRADLYRARPDRIRVEGWSEAKNLFAPDNRRPYFGFAPPPGWKGRIEIRPGRPPGGRGRILYISIVPPEIGGKIPGGVATHAWELARIARERGYEVDLVSEIDFPAVVDGVNLIPLPKRNPLLKTARLAAGLLGGRILPNPYSFLKARPRIRASYRALVLQEILDSRRPDLVHVHQLIDQNILSLALLRFRPAVVLTDHGVGLVNDRGMHRLYGYPSMAAMAAQARSAAAVAHTVFCLSSYSALSLERLGIPAKKIVTVPAPVSAERIRFLPDRAALKESLGLGGKPLVFFMGVHSAWDKKGLDILLRAFAADRRLKERCRLLVVTQGEPLRLARREAAAAGIDARIEEPRPWETLNRYLNAADAFVMPSRMESIGLVYVEALAAGTPVVGYHQTVEEFQRRLGTDIGEPFRADAETSADLAAKIAAVLSRPFDRKALRETALGALSWDAQFERIDEVYRRLRREAPPSPAP